MTDFADIKRLADQAKSMAEASERKILGVIEECEKTGDTKTVEFAKNILSLAKAGKMDEVLNMINNAHGTAR